MKISKTLSPSTIFCDRENGIITISSIDGTKIIIDGIINFENWSEKFKSLIISDNSCHMSDDSSVDNTLTLFFEKFTNLIYSNLIKLSDDKIEKSCNDIFNVVSQHIIKENLNG